MRKRIEDLGRIAVLVEKLFDADVWYVYTGRNKDFVDYFNELDDEKKDDILHKLIYGLDDLKSSISDISLIAEGTDRLNESD